MKKITQVIKKTRTIEEEYEVCPHCEQEIREKESFVDDENYVYHRPCMAKGPIDKIKPMSSIELADALGWGDPNENRSREEHLRYERTHNPVAEEVRNKLQGRIK